MSFRHGISVVEVDVDGGGMPPGPPLAALSFASTPLRVDQAVSLLMLGATAGAARSIVGGALPPGLAFNWSTLELSGSPITAGDYQVTFCEESATAPNSPRYTVMDFTVAPAEILLTDMDLGAVTLTDAMQPGDAVAAVAGDLQGAALSMEGAAFEAGQLALNGAGTAIVVGAAGPLEAGSETGEFLLVKTLEAATNSPHPSGPFGPFQVAEANPAVAPFVITDPVLPATAPRVGQPFVAAPAEWGGTGPISVSRQWQSLAEDWQDVEGETALSITPAAEIEGLALRLIEAAESDHGAAVSMSDPSLPVAPAEEPGDLANTVPPALIGDPYVSAAITIDSGAWEGAAPFAFRYRIRTTAPSTLMDWTSEPEFDAEPAIGDILLLDVECTDANGDTAIAQSAPFGPMEAAAFTPTVVASLNFRNTSGYIADGPGQTYVLPGDTALTTRGGATFRVNNTSHSDVSLSGVSDPRLRGRCDMSSSLGRVRVDCPVGNIRIWLSSGLLSASAGNVSWGLYDGEPGQPGSALITSFDGSIAGGSVADATGTVRSYAAWQALGAGAPIDTECTQGSIWLRRKDGSSNALRVNHLHIETRA